MIDTLFDDPLTQFCALIVVAVCVRLISSNAIFRLVTNAVFFALLTTLLLSHDIEPYVSDVPAQLMSRRIAIAFVKSFWWLAGAMVLVSGVRLFLIFERKPREGRLLQDLVIGMIYLSAGLSVIAYVFSVPVGTLIATSGVFAIVLGLAMQSTLADVFSGIALNLGRPYSVGDWIVLDDGTQGRVVETNWRSTHLLNGTNDLVIVPNSGLAKARLVNLSSPDETHGISLTIRMHPSKSPASIENVMRTVLMSSNVVLKTPEPGVTITGVDRQAITAELSCRVRDISKTGAAKNEIYDLIYRHAKAAGLSFANSSDISIIEPGPKSDDEGVRTHSTPRKLLNSISLFATLTDDEKESLSASMKRLVYGKDAVIAVQDSSLTSLMIVRSGVVIVERCEGGKLVELNRLSPGDCFGELGVLMGAAESASVRRRMI